VDGGDLEWPKEPRQDLLRSALHDQQEVACAAQLLLQVGPAAEQKDVSADAGVGTVEEAAIEAEEDEQLCGSPQRGVEGGMDAEAEVRPEPKAVVTATRVTGRPSRRGRAWRTRGSVGASAGAAAQGAAPAGRWQAPPDPSPPPSP